MKHKKALVVASNANSRELVRILLEHEGFQTVETADTDGALELASAESPDVILIDLQMPRREGYSTAVKLRKNGRFEKLIVALTARDQDSDPAQLAASGFTTFISQPVVLRNFHDRLAQLLP